MNKRGKRDTQAQKGETESVSRRKLPPEQLEILAGYIQTIQKIQQQAEADIQTQRGHLNNMLVTVLSGAGIPRDEWSAWAPDFATGELVRGLVPAGPPAHEQPHGAWPDDESGA